MASRMDAGLPEEHGYDIAAGRVYYLALTSKGSLRTMFV